MTSKPLIYNIFAPVNWKYTSQLLLMILFGLHRLSAQESGDDYVNPHHIRYTDYIYDDSIHTVLLHKTGWVLSDPIIALNSDDMLQLDFDDFRDLPVNYAYTFIHCNADWSPSDLVSGEYIDGLTEDYLTDYQYSRTPVQHYIHYKLQFPNASIKPSISGNFLLVVYSEGIPDQPVLTKRFYVLEEHCTISARIEHPSDVSWRDYKQAVNFNISFNPDVYNLTDPFANVKVTVVQNHRTDNAKFGLKPVFVKDGALDYSYIGDENDFYGGNEFRYFDLKSLNYHSEFIENVWRDSAGYHCLLKQDIRRSSKVYLEYSDINGRRLIKTDERGYDTDVDGEYVDVIFRLPYKIPLKKTDLYVFGELSNWQLNPAFRMTYEPSIQSYLAHIYIKQGYYNYLYVKSGDNGTIDETFIEGTHFETENDYLIMVYYRDITDQYDRLVGTNFFNSRRNR